MDILASSLNSIKKTDEDLYVACISDGIEILFKLPPIKKAEEYSCLLKTSSSYSLTVIIYEHIFKEYVVDPFYRENLDIPAGIVESIVKNMLYLSGVDESSLDYTKELMEIYRQQSKLQLSFMKRKICSIFQGYTFEMLDKLNYQNIVKLFIEAEQELIERGIIESEYIFIDKEAQKKDHAKSIQEQIKMDKMAYNSFNTDKDQQQQNVKMAEYRKQAEERARLEEKKYRKRLMGG